MHAPSPSRRQVLSGAAAALVATTAGCADAFDVEVDPSSDPDGTGRTLTLTLSGETETLRERFVTDLEETDPRWDEAALTETLDGNAYRTQYRQPFYTTPGDHEYANLDGTFYRLDAVVVDEATTTHPVLRLYAVEGNDADGNDADGNDANGNAESDGAAVAAAALPEADERAVRIAHMATRARGNVGGVPVGLVQRGGHVYRNAPAIADSRLLADDGPDRVTYRDDPYRVEVETETFHEPVYRAAVERVADEPETMEAILRATFVEARFDPADRSAEANQVLRAARADGHAESHPFSAGFEEVLRALDERPYLDGNIRKDATASEPDRTMLRYGDHYYEYRLRFDAAPDG
jgi:hypothetical protein